MQWMHTYATMPVALIITRFAMTPFTLESGLSSARTALGRRVTLSPGDGTFPSNTKLGRRTTRVVNRSSLQQNEIM
jgi:hypothetical protein